MRTTVTASGTTYTAAAAALVPCRENATWWQRQLCIAKPKAQRVLRATVVEGHGRWWHTLISLELRTVYTVPVASGGSPERHPCDEAET